MQNDQEETEGCQVGRQDHLGNSRHGKPNPSEPDKKEIGTGVTMKFEKPEPLTKPEPVPRKKWFAGISGSPTGSWKIWPHARMHWLRGGAPRQ